MEEKKKFYITTAIVYSSRKPHIGNTYEVIAADAIARYKRMRGYDVFFLTGTDEHGQKIENCAAEAGMTPKEYVDKVAGEIRAIWDKMGASYDRFIRTTDEDHTRTVQRVFKKLYDQGDIYKDEYEGWYCVPCETFFTETQAKEADYRCPDCGAALKKTRETAYKFRASAYADRLIKYLDEHPDFIEPESRRREMVNNFLAAGLQDLCVTRSSFRWGVPVSFDDGHVIYVWIDALLNYITALGYGEEGGDERYRRYWPCDVHVIGKDIMRFHAIYWPILLMALGEPLPKKILGHPWFLFGNDKMSKSKGNVLYADELADLFGVDGVRHYCLAEMPFANDGNITVDAMINRCNADLANNLGNLVSRTVAMTKKYFDGIVPAPTEPAPLDAELTEFCTRTCDTFCKQMDSYHIADAVETLFALFSRANKYIDETTPWALAKDEAQQARLGTVLYRLLDTIRFGAALLTPLLPETAARIRSVLGDADDARTVGTLPVGTVLGDAVALFSRIDEKEMHAKLDAKMEAAKIAAAKTEKKAEKESAVTATAECGEITIDDFMKTELRCAAVLAAEPVKKSDKLLKLQLDLGDGQTRQVVSGIAKFYQSQDLVGRRVIVVSNLAPATLRGERSEGMILAGGEEKPCVIFCPDDVPLGARIR